jgi:hypothetical protein
MRFNNIPMAIAPLEDTKKENFFSMGMRMEEKTFMKEVWG